MKYAIIILFVGLISLALSSGNSAHGIVIPESTHDLLEKSATIFVGNITATKTLQFEEHSTIVTSENGTDKTIIKNYTLNLDQYTVNVDKYLKNPQNSNKMTVMQPTVSITEEVGGLNGFKTGDHVLFYVEKLDGNNTYSPESFALPTFCNGEDVLTQERPVEGSNFTVIQNGVKVDFGNFTANKPIKFIAVKDMGTLYGKSYDLKVALVRNSGGNTETVLDKEIHSSSKPCEWTATAEWEFTPQEGRYEMGVVEKENGIVTGTSDTPFTVKSNMSNTDQMSPLEQFRMGVKLDKTQCPSGFQLVEKSSDNSPACVKPNTENILIERGWAKPIQITVLPEKYAQNETDPSTSTAPEFPFTMPILLISIILLIIFYRTGISKIRTRL